MCLLEEATLPLQKRDRTVAIIFDGFDFNLPSSHVGGIMRFAMGQGKEKKAKKRR